MDKGNMKSKYHTEAFKILKTDPEIVPNRQKIIEDREKVCNVQFPESVKEWFSIKDVEKIFYENSNSDNLVPVEKLGDPKEAEQGYLKIAAENQGVVGWYVRLNDGDNPAVYDNNDEWDKKLDKVHWRLIARSFTEFILKLARYNQ